MSRVLVIGAGYLGEEILRIFREEGWDAQGVSLGGGDGLLACDVGDADCVRRLPDADAVVHCASSGRGGEDAYRRVYLQGCRNLVARFPGADILFTSSSSVYAQVGGQLVTEESETVPDRETGRLLLEAERVILDAGGIVARLAGIYGPGRSVLLRKFLEEEAVIEDDGGRFLNQIHRDDAARAVVDLLTMGNFPAGQIFNVSDSESLTQLEVYQGLARIFGRDLPPSGPRDLNRKRGWTNKRVSNAKLRAETGWKPQYPCFLDAVGGL
ncbi:NAD-dependent epimerase/dehydratase family protein [Akkermansiaceae bacterium]|nr:NAD-dependent epimerase/dehydratase family protein [Akkermansiaceae bacterium]